MAIFRVLSAGAARSVVERLSDRFARESGHRAEAQFGAVGEIAARVTRGEPVDVVIVTAALIEQLEGSGHVEPGTRGDLGRVGTGVAVRAGTPPPEVTDRRALRGNLLAARRIVCPDPAIATAGKILVRALEQLGVADEVRPRLQFFPNGHAAMTALAAGTGLHELGITQITEILPIRGITYVGALPEALQMKTVYSIALAARAQNAGAAREFIARVMAPSARPMLKSAGYELS